MEPPRVSRRAPGPFFACLSVGWSAVMPDRIRPLDYLFQRPRPFLGGHRGGEDPPGHEFTPPKAICIRVSQSSHHSTANFAN